MQSEDGKASQSGTDAPAQLSSDAAERFPIVGIGASAGGLDAFEAFLAALAPDTGMAFVLIQHLHPMHASLMGDLLTSHTRMPVTQAGEKMAIEPNRVYIIPPGVSLAVADGKLHLSERHDPQMAFDIFLASLAKDRGDRSACVVHSGTGTDGSEGLKAIKAKGGLVVVQDPDEAAFDGMPKSAIRTGRVDFVLPVAEIPGALVQHASGAGFPYARPLKKPDAETQYSEILGLVRSKTRHDFSPYKTGTLTRRIERRMTMAGVSDADRYVEKLKTDAAELDSLAQDLLINVTQFFRDADTFEVLAESVIPEMVAKHPDDRPLRVWVPGCSTGEEVYSLAILFLEAIGAARRQIKLQIFASDIDTHAFAFARAGVYGREIELQVSPERLARFFTREDDTYRVVPELRDVIVFTVQDLLVDPPFSRLDLISCRNVLIYLRAEAQEQILSLFHFALQVGGVLILGRSETVAQGDQRFQPINKKQRIFRHISGRRAGELDFLAHVPSLERLRAPQATMKSASRRNPGELAQKLLIDAYAPASVMVDAKYEGIYYSGAVDRYFKVTSGEVNRNILVMAREGLRPKLRAALEGARESGELTWKKGAQVRRNGTTSSVKIVVQPVPAEQLFLVSFLEEPMGPPSDADVAKSDEDNSRISQLEQELDATRRELNATIRDLEFSNEDLRAVNEEALSINEEFQITNEELETSKEELQALNEELTVVNSQLQETLEQQRATAADLQNILNSADSATLFLDAALKIRFYTPAVKSLFGVTGVDIGRPLADLAQRFEDDALLDDTRKVLTEPTSIRREIESRDGNWYIRSVQPYRTDTSAIEGVVLTFTRISEIKAAERKIEGAKAYAESIIATVRQPLLVLDEKFRTVSASASFFEVFDVRPSDCVGRPLALGGQPQVEFLAEFLASANGANPIQDAELTIDLPKLGPRIFLLSARALVDGASESSKMLISLDDITDAKLKEETLAAAKDAAERANMAKSRFLAAASHDLRQPLQTITLLKSMLSKAVPEQGTVKLIDQLDKTVRSMSTLLDKLLDINQLEAGVVRPRLVNFAINDLLKQLQAEFDIHALNNGLDLRVVPCHLRVHSDPRLLEQILRNLLSNATKYTRQGKVLLGCRRRGPFLSIEVWDNGIGIPEGELIEIFREFHQLDNRIVKRTKGLGLGLAIVQRLAELLGTHITVRSVIDRGSVFAVEVPLVQSPVQAAAPPPEPVSRPQVEGVQRELPERAHAILIIEDDAEVRDILKMLLDSRGYRTFAAPDGPSALDIAADCAADLDLIVADYNLPGANGVEIVARIEEAAGRKIPVIMLTGDISAATLLEIAGKGHVHLYKPADAQDLIHHIDAMLYTGGGKAGAPTLFVVDDEEASREAMRDILQMHGYRVEVFEDGASFLQAYSPERAGCLIAEARMAGPGPLDLIERLAEIGSSLPVIIVASHGDVAMAVTAIKAGAFEFLEKPAREDELLTGVEAALRQSRQRSQLSTDAVIAARKIESLTDRQRQILDFLLEGSSSEAIATRLGISARTVDTHCAAIMKKFGVQSLYALIRMGLAASSLRGSGD
jgi:two-component system CheB/CheR fusion protein